MANPGAADIQSRRRKDWVLLRSYVFADKIPKKVDVAKCSLDFVGNPGGRKFFTGIYGTNSGDAGGFLATNWANANRTEIFFLDVWAEIPNFHTSRAQMTREILEQSHWLHLDRMSVSLRDEIKEKMAFWTKKKYGLERALREADMNCQQILLEHPDYAARILEEDEDIGMIVHPIHTKFDVDADRQLSLWAATIRTDVISIRGAEIRYAPDVECVI